PGRRLASGRAIEHGDRMGARYVDENPLRLQADLKAFGMHRQANIAELFLLRDIDGRNGAAAIADQNAISRGIEANVVGIAAQLYPPGRRVIGAVKELHRAIARIGDIDRIRRRHVADALWLCQAADRADNFAFPDIDDAEAVVAELGHEKTRSRNI